MFFWSGIDRIYGYAIIASYSQNCRSLQKSVPEAKLRFRLGKTLLFSKLTGSGKRFGKPHLYYQGVILLPNLTSVVRNQLSFFGETGVESHVSRKRLKVATCHFSIFSQDLSLHIKKGLRATLLPF